MTQTFFCDGIDNFFLLIIKVILVDFLAVYIKNILLCVIFLTYIEMILPDDKYKKYINLVSGLILILVIISPIKNFYDKHFIFNSNNFEVGKHDKKNFVSDIYKQSVNKQINMLAKKMGIKILNAEIKIAEENNTCEIKNLKINFDYDCKIDDKKKFLYALSLIYKIGAENIICD